MLIVALPAIQRDLDLGAGELSWVAACYALVFGGFLVAGGRAADLAGPRTMFVTGNLLVGAGSLAAALAPGAGLLLAGRSVQGLGAAIAVPAALAALLAATDGVRRPRALGLWTMAGAAGGACGFLLGGVVTAYVGWRWLFAAVVPIVLAATALAPLLLPRDDRRPGRLDLPGTVLSTLAAVLLILGCNRAEAYGFGSPAAWVPLAAVPLAVLAFVAVERRTADPVVPPHLWSVREFRTGAAVAAVLTSTTGGAAVIGSLFLQDDLGLSAAASGAAFLLFSVGVVVSSTGAPVLVRRFGTVPAMALGLATVAVALALQTLAVFREGAPALFLVGLALGGLGLGVASMASTAHGTAKADERSTGIVGGLLNAAAQIGTAVGIAVLLAIGGGWSLLAAVAVAALAALAVRATRQLVTS